MTSSCGHDWKSKGNAFVRSRSCDRSGLQKKREFSRSLCSVLFVSPLWMHACFHLMAYLISSNKSHSVWCLRCRRPSCSVCVFFNSCVTFTWRADDIIRGEEEDGTCQLHKHTHTHCPTWAHYCVSSSSQLYAPQRQIHKLSKQQENKPCNETNIFMVDSIYKKNV